MENENGQINKLRGALGRSRLHSPGSGRRVVCTNATPLRLEEDRIIPSRADEIFCCPEVCCTHE